MDGTEENEDVNLKWVPSQHSDQEEDDLLKKTKRPNRGILSSPNDQYKVSRKPRTTHIMRGNKKGTISDKSITHQEQQEQEQNLIKSQRPRITQKDVEKAIGLTGQCIVNALLLSIVVARIALKSLFHVGKKVLTIIVLTTNSQTEIINPGTSFINPRPSSRIKEVIYRGPNLGDISYDDRPWSACSEWRTEMSRLNKTRRARMEYAEE